MVVAIMLVGFATSYRTMAEFLIAHQMDTVSAWSIPATVDMLALAATIARHILPKSRYALFVALASVSASVAANVGGAPNVVTGIGHGWPVVAYLLGEGLVVRLLTAKVEAAPVVEVVEVEAAPVKAKPAKPATAGKARGNYGPRGDEYAPRTKRAHAAAARVAAQSAE
jgi:hypothetical protein